MKKLFMLFAVVLYANFSYAQTIHHNLTVDVNIKANTIDVVDTMNLPLILFKNSEVVIFYLNNNLEIKSLNKQFEIVKLDAEDIENSRAVTLTKYAFSSSSP